VPYLVDGSNLGGQLGGKRGARDRAAVLELLLSWIRSSAAGEARPPRRRVVVVFDGPPDTALASACGPLEVRFAGARSADEVILATLGERAGDWQVVSADRALRAACRDRGARTLDVDALLAGARRRTSKVVDAVSRTTDAAVDVEDWEAWFRRGGEEGDD